MRKKTRIENLERELQELRNLIAPTPKLKKRKNYKEAPNAGKAWTSEELLEAAGLLEKGIPLEMVGKVFGRTGKSVACQMTHYRQGTK